MSKYPECEKLLAVHKESRAIANFLEWCNDKGITLCSSERGEYNDWEYLPINKSFIELEAEYFKIDLNVVEQERRAMLEDACKAFAGE